MFSLIITIISIALVAALALATLYYGGTAFNKGATTAKASQYINEGQQINGAVAMLKADAAGGASGLTGATAAVSSLAPNYLSQLPAGWDGALLISGGVAKTAAAVDSKVCAEVNVKAGVETADADTVSVADNATLVFGCVTKAGDADLNKVFYRF